MFGEQEIFFTCPYCSQKISFLLEVTHGSQRYIEDCEVCCCPIDMSYSVENGEIINLQAERAQ